MAEQYEVNWQDYYKILEIEPLCDDEQLIKAAYRKLCLQWGKKANIGDEPATARMKLINEAYEYVSNPNKRSAYNMKYQEHTDSHGGTARDNHFAQPKPSLEPSNRYLGTIPVGEVRSVSFRAENRGAAGIRSCRLLYTPTEYWLSLDYDAESLPCNIDARINTSELIADKDYEGMVVLIIDGINSQAKIGFRTTAAAVPDNVADKHVMQQGIFPWPSWKWQRVALILAVPAALSLFLVSNTYATIIGIVLLFMAIYGGIETSWLKSVSKAGVPAKLAAGIATGTSLIGIGISAIYIAILGVFIVILLLAIGVATTVIFSAIRK